MNRDLTVIYYTCHREDPKFEARIRRTLWHTIKGLPLISVSHKPIDFGENICVGDVGVSSQNAFRQFQVGAMAAKTRFVCPAEADFLYPREYFQFRPPREDMFYRAVPVYVLFAQRGKANVFCRKLRGSEAAIVVGRDFIIKTIERQLSGKGMWQPKLEDHKAIPFLMDHRRREGFDLSIPVVTFKTENNIHRKTPHTQEGRTRELPYWGDAGELIRKYLG